MDHPPPCSPLRPPPPFPPPSLPLPSSPSAAWLPEVCACAVAVLSCIQRPAHIPRPRPSPGWPILSSDLGSSEWRRGGPVPGCPLPEAPPRHGLVSFRLRRGRRTAPRLPEGGVRGKAGPRSRRLWEGKVGFPGYCFRVLGAWVERGTGQGPGGLPEARRALDGRELRTRPARAAESLRGGPTASALLGVSMVTVNKPQLPQLQLPSPRGSTLL